MPNKPDPENAARTIRVRRSLWEATGAYAKDRNRTVSSLAVELFTALTTRTGLLVHTRPDILARLARLGDDPGVVLEHLATAELGRRADNCHPTHLGPIYSGACGHCGQDTE